MCVYTLLFSWLLHMLYIMNCTNLCMMESYNIKSAALQISSTLSEVVVIRPSDPNPSFFHMLLLLFQWSCVIQQTYMTHRKPLVVLTVILVYLIICNEGSIFILISSTTDIKLPFVHTCLLVWIVFDWCIVEGCMLMYTCNLEYFV